MAIYAYIRVSTQGNKSVQTTDNQAKLIRDAGFAVDSWFSEEGVSGSIPALDRPAFKEMYADLNAGDTVIATAIDRLGRNARDILEIVEMFQKTGVKLRILALDAVDLTSSMGKLLVTLMGAFAELERNMTIERVNAGLARTREQGTIFGKKEAATPEVMEAIMKGIEQGISHAKLAKGFGISTKSVQRYVAKYYKKEALEDFRVMFNKKIDQHAAKL